MRLPRRIATFILNNSLNLFIILKDDIETAKENLFTGYLPGKE